MSDLNQKIDETTTRLLAATKERDQAEAERNRYEQAAKAIRKASEEARAVANREAFEQEELSRKADEQYRTLKKEIEALNAGLRHTVVAKTVEDSAAAQKKAQADAEATLARLNEKEKAIDAKLAELAKVPAPAAEPQA